MDAEPVMLAATVLAMAISRFAANATTTVSMLSLEPEGALSSAMGPIMPGSTPVEFHSLRW